MRKIIFTFQKYARFVNVISWNINTVYQLLEISISARTIVNNNYIIVNNNFSEYIINLCGFRFFLGHPVERRTQDIEIDCDGVLGCKRFLLYIL